ncbi:site-specific integrase [Helicobacter pylori]|nr:site-specific integrase [Helicobacter pylori]
MSDYKMSRVSRELFNNIKSFLHHKLKTMIRIQSMNDLQLVLKWQDRVLECQSLIALKELNRKLYNQGIRHTIIFEKRNQCILLLIVLGGLRKFEALDLELKNIALENNHYRLLIKGKNNKERYAYIEKEFLQVPLNAWLSDTKRLKSFKGRFVFKKAKNNTTQKTCSLKGFIAKIFKLSNIDVKSYGLGLHLFRHSFATFIYDATQDLVLTSRALGHSSLLSTKIYIHTTQEHNKKVALVLGG